MVSQAWKDLSDSERAKWIDIGRRDRERYDREKAVYKGPWKVPDVKDPHAPKKPMSAFLAFGNERRRSIADANPQLSNVEISNVLAQLWRDCPPDVKEEYRQREAKERALFKVSQAAYQSQKKKSSESPATTLSASVMMDTSIEHHSTGAAGTNHHEDGGRSPSCQSNSEGHLSEDGPIFQETKSLLTQGISTLAQTAATQHATATAALTTSMAFPSIEQSSSSFMTALRATNPGIVGLPAPPVLPKVGMGNMNSLLDVYDNDIIAERTRLPSPSKIGHHHHDDSEEDYLMDFLFENAEFEDHAPQETSAVPLTTMMGLPPPCAMVAPVVVAPPLPCQSSANDVARAMSLQRHHLQQMQPFPASASIGNSKMAPLPTMTPHLPTATTPEAPFPVSTSLTLPTLQPMTAATLSSSTMSAQPQSQHQSSQPESDRLRELARKLGETEVDLLIGAFR